MVGDPGTERDRELRPLLPLLPLFGAGARARAAEVGESEGEHRRLLLDSPSSNGDIPQRPDDDSSWCSKFWNLLSQLAGWFSENPWSFQIVMLFISLGIVVIPYINNLSHAPEEEMGNLTPDQLAGTMGFHRTEEYPYPGVAVAASDGYAIRRTLESEEVFYRWLVSALTWVAGTLIFGTRGVRRRIMGPMSQPNLTRYQRLLKLFPNLLVTVGVVQCVIFNGGYLWLRNTVGASFDELLNHIKGIAAGTEENSLGVLGVTPGLLAAICRMLADGYNGGNFSPKVQAGLLMSSLVSTLLLLLAAFRQHREIVQLREKLDDGLDEEQGVLLLHRAENFVLPEALRVAVLGAVGGEDAFATGGEAATADTNVADLAAFFRTGETVFGTGMGTEADIDTDDNSLGFPAASPFAARLADRLLEGGEGGGGGGELNPEEFRRSAAALDADTSFPLPERNQVAAAMRAVASAKCAQAGRAVAAAAAGAGSVRNLKEAAENLGRAMEALLNAMGENAANRLLGEHLVARQSPRLFPMPMPPLVASQAQAIAQFALQQIAKLETMEISNNDEGGDLQRKLSEARQLLNGVAGGAGAEDEVNMVRQINEQAGTLLALVHTMAVSQASASAAAGENPLLAACTVMVRSLNQLVASVGEVSDLALTEDNTLLPLPLPPPSPPPDSGAGAGVFDTPEGGGGLGGGDNSSVASSVNFLGLNG